MIERHDGKLYTILLNYKNSGCQYGIFWYDGEDVPANFTECYLIFCMDNEMTREMGMIAIRWGRVVSGYVDIETQQIYWYPLLYSKIGNGHFEVYIIEADVSGDKNLYTPLIIDYYNRLRNDTLFEIVLHVGSVHRISGMKANLNYGYMYDISYDIPVPIVYSKVLNNGEWSEWTKILE